MKYCTQCGKAVDDNAKYCSNCGAIILETIVDANVRKSDKESDYDSVLKGFDDVITEARSIHIEDNNDRIIHKTENYQDYVPSFQEQIEKEKINTKREKLSIAENFYEITKGLHIIGTASIAHLCSLLFIGFLARPKGGFALIRFLLSLLICFGIFKLSGKYLITLEDFREFAYDWLANRIRSDLPLNYSDYSKMVSKERKDASGFFTILGYIFGGMLLLDGTLLIGMGFSILATILLAVSAPTAIITIIIAVVARRRLSISRKNEYK